MNKKIFFIILLLPFTLNSIPQKKKVSILEKAVTVLDKTLDVASTTALKLLDLPTDTIGRDIHKLDDAFSSRFLNSPEKRLPLDERPLGQVIYNNNPSQLEEYLCQHSINVNNTFFTGTNFMSSDKISLLEYALLSRAPHSIKILLDAGANPNRLGTIPETPYPLQIALINNPSRSGYVYTFNFVEDLLKAGADPNLFPSVAYAVNKARGKNIDLLLSYGAKIEMKDAAGKSALFYAVENYYADVADHLVEKGADIKTVSNEGEDLPTLIQKQLDQLPQKNNTPTIWDPLQVYISRALSYITIRHSLLSKLQTNGSKFYYTKNPILTPRTMEYFDVTTQQGMQSLMVSTLITADKADELKEFLHKNNLSINMYLGQSKDYPGSTLLDHAIIVDAKNVFTMLLAMGADINKKSIYPNILHKGYKISKSPLQTALSNPNLFYDETLINSGADFASVNIIELLQLGSSESTKKLIALWLAKGSDINVKDPKTGKTPIYYAIDREDVMFHNAVFLVEQGADLTVKDKDNQTPVQYLQTRINTIFAPKNSMCMYQYSELEVLIQKIQDKGFDLYYNTAEANPELIPNITKRRAQQNQQE